MTANTSDIVATEFKNKNGLFMQTQLEFLRAMIDNIDGAILHILAHRGQVVRYIQCHKKQQQLPEQRSLRRQQTIQALLTFSETLSLRPAFVKALLETLFQSSTHFLKTPEKDDAALLMIAVASLDDLNRTLKHLDMALLSLLAERMALVKRVCEFKKQHQLPPLSLARWQEVLKSKRAMAEQLHINPVAIEQFYDVIHQEALAIEAEC